jgi:predicted phosphodiesterase
MAGDESHDLVARIKAVTADLGHVPSMREFETHESGVGSAVVRRVFGGYTALCQAAGLPTYSERGHKPVKITNAIFTTPLERHLEKMEPTLSKAHEPWLRTLFIGDCHHPFSHRPTLERIYRFAEREQPSLIVQGGDLNDQFSAQKFPRSHNVFTPRDEMTTARKHGEEMWAEIRRVCPKARCVQMFGNHDLRPLKRVLENFPVGEDWITEKVKELMSFPGVELIEDHRQELILPGNVQVLHGYRNRLGEHRDFTLMNSVVFHTHRGGVAFRNVHGQVLWELNGGYVADEQAKGLTYTPQRITNNTRGWGWLDELGPRFIPG